MPEPDAQRSLADVVLDPSQPPAIRKQSASQLVHNIRRFGRLITADQEARLTTTLREETDPEVRASLLTIFRALLPAPPVSSAQTSCTSGPRHVLNTTANSTGGAYNTPSTRSKPVIFHLGHSWIHVLNGHAPAQRVLPNLIERSVKDARHAR